jgi:putative hydrolase of the HAD superfamily
MVPAMFDAVLFDLDETLIPDEAVSRHAFAITAQGVTRDAAKATALAEAAERQAKALWKTLPAAAAAYAERIGHSALEGQWATYDAAVPEEAELERAMARLRPETWRLALAECGLAGDPAFLASRWQALRARFPLFPDADEVLVRLAGTVKLGLITNGVSGLQRRKLNGCGLLHWFDAVAVSGEVGIGKPQPGIFEWTAKQLGVPLEKCVMVGDNPERDVQGGLNAGIATVWVDRGLKPRGAKATFECKELRELLPWLRARGVPA